MREINAQDITAVVKKLCMEANYFLPEDIQDKICKACESEPWPLAQSILGVIKVKKNAMRSMFLLAFSYGYTKKPPGFATGRLNFTSAASMRRWGTCQHTGGNRHSLRSRLRPGIRA